MSFNKVSSVNGANIGNTIINGHTINSASSRTLIMDVSTKISLLFKDNDNTVLELKNNNFLINETDSINLTKLVEVFKDIKDNNPSLYADLILKGIIE